MKTILSLSTAIIVAGSFVSCNSIDQSKNAATGATSINDPAAPAPNLANTVSNVAGLASNVNSVRKLVGDEDEDGSDKLTNYLGAAQLGTGLLSKFKKPNVPSAPGSPNVPGVPNVGVVPDGPSLGGVPKVPGLPKLPGLPGFGPKVPTPIAVSTGMNQADLMAAAGRPSYKYTLNGQETWVYENTSFVAKKLKQTAVNMVPGLGPAASLMTSFRGKPTVARAVVSFDQNGVVKYFTQSATPTNFASVAK